MIASKSDIDCKSGNDFETLYLTADSSNTLLVEIDVESCKIQFLVDTGAVSTIIDENLFRSLFSDEIELESCDKTFWACGTLLNAVGKAELTFRVASLEFKQWVTIVNLGAPVALLGLDFMRRNNVVLHLGSREMRIGEVSIALSNQSESPVCQLRLAEKVTVHGLSECVVYAEPCENWSTCANGSSAQVVASVLFEQKFLGRGIYLVPGVVDPSSQRIPLAIIHCGNETIELPKDFVIAEMHVCETLSPVCDAEVDEPGEVAQAKTEELPDCLKDLLKNVEFSTEDHKSQAYELLSEFADVFSKPGEALGRTSVVQHRIPTKTDKPVKINPYRLGWEKRKIAEQEVSEMLKQGVLQPSDSDYCSPVVLVKKKDGSWRFCADYRKLNEQTVSDCYQLPRIEDILDSLGNSKYFHTADLKSGYWQIEMHPEDRKKTAIGVPGVGFFEFCVMPFGLKGAPACFQRLMEKVLKDILWKRCLVFLDDILAFGDTFESSLESLREVLLRLRKAGLKLKPQKCKFFRQRVEFLGHVISAEGVACDEEKIAAVRDWPPPCNLKDLQAF